jgi:uncharacterized protein (TIGR03067 family)
MRRSIAAVAFLALAVPIARAEEKDAKELEGSYEVVSVLVGGKPDDKKKDEVKSFAIKDGMLTVKLDKREESAKFTVDKSKKPAHIDIMPTGDDKVLGIYETKDTDKGTELTIAFKEGGPKESERPKDFKGDGKDDLVIKLFRKK